MGDITTFTAGLFSLGQVCATPGALAALKEAHTTVSEVICRHASGDWGDLDTHDRLLNDEAVISADDRIFSVYVLATGITVYVITECDRSSTTVLLASEY